MAIKISKNSRERMAMTVARLTLDGEIEKAQTALSLLSSFSNQQRLPGEQGQPGFGRGWGFGDPYNSEGYGRAQNCKRVPNTGDLPTSFDPEEGDEGDDERESVDAWAMEEPDADEDLEILDEDEYLEDMDNNLFDPDDFDMQVHAANEEEDEDTDNMLDEDILFDPDDFNMDVVFAEAVDIVEQRLGKKEAQTFSSLFGIIGGIKTAEEKEDMDEDMSDLDDDDLDEEEFEEKKPRSKREVMQVWQDDLIPDITPIIRRVLKHVSVQYSLPYSSLTNALRGQESAIASMLADALEGIPSSTDE